jgi:hypothetical protein
LTSPAESKHGSAVIMISGAETMISISNIKTKKSLSSSFAGFEVVAEFKNKPSVKITAIALCGRV